ncbi:hypothetical protein BYT27DRAFT_7234324 [Phlegmacium glaucopus]|nr:hypothetical protein BYT27DRAFT_7234324 [Phlegmacium glaucopus]
MASAQTIVLPDIPELYEKNFLDILLPPTKVDDDFMIVEPAATPPVVNPMIDALILTSQQTFTTNRAPAYNTTNSAILDAFNNLSNKSLPSDVARYLAQSWKEDPGLTLRLIWNLRSIPDGKGSKETFYRAFGWLYDNHPRTAISNLHLLVEPVCLPVKQTKSAKAHGCWKDLLNILCLVTLDELNANGQLKFLHAPRMKFTYPHRNRYPKTGTPASRIEKSIVEGQKRKVVARDTRTNELSHYHKILVSKLSQPKFRALYVAVARLFADQLVNDIKILYEIKSLKPDGDRIALMKQISLAGKWAPTPAAYDRVTNIATAIAQLIHAAQVISPYPSALNNPISPHDRSVILRSFYQRWVLTELRKISAIPEPLMASNRWTEIKYSRVPSICMNNNSSHFYSHDPKGFEQYIVKVETGKKSISGATMLPHELVAQILALKNGVSSGGRGKKTKKLSTIPAVIEARKTLIENETRVIEAQWKTLIESLREAGSLDNCMAICDVSGSMGNIGAKYDKNNVAPIFPAVALSLVLASLAKPPFNAGFITFSYRPEFLRVDLTQSLLEQVTYMSRSDWSANTDFRAVFIDLLLPLAVKNKLKQEDMIKRLFVFSDMQFDSSHSSWPRDTTKWETTYDLIERAYQRAGYEVPQIVFWDLNAEGIPKTVEVLSDRKGVAMMNGFSPALLKVFMGEEEESSEWEEVSEDGSKSVTVVEKEDEFNPFNVMKKALMRKTFDGLVVLD